jgi:hypothetical protein
MAAAQHWTSPSPVLVHSTIVLQVAHTYRFPNWLAMCVSSVPSIPTGGYFLRVMGWLQQISAPFPPLVTMNSEPHLAQRYLFPVSLATSERILCQ